MGRTDRQPHAEQVLQAGVKVAFQRQLPEARSPPRRVSAEKREASVPPAQVAVLPACSLIQNTVTLVAK